MIVLNLDYTSGVPIYVQVKEALKNAIRSGTFPQGAQLPTVRQLAIQLKINANTVARAYTELERENVISSQQGRGTFVTLRQDYAKLGRLQEIVEKTLAEAEQMGYSHDHVIAMIEHVRTLHARPDKGG